MLSSWFIFFNFVDAKFIGGRTRRTAHRLALVASTTTDRPTDQPNFKERERKCFSFLCLRELSEIRPRQGKKGKEERRWKSREVSYSRVKWTLIIRCIVSRGKMFHLLCFVADEKKNNNNNNNINIFNTPARWCSCSFLFIQRLERILMWRQQKGNKSAVDTHTQGWSAIQFPAGLFILLFIFLNEKGEKKKTNCCCCKEILTDFQVRFSSAFVHM